MDAASNQYGLCACGCGRPAAIAKRTRPYLGHVAGEPTRFAHGHGAPPPPALSGVDSPTWKGGRNRVSGGYILVKIEDDDPLIAMADARGYVYEHRVVMARHIGRPLTREEVVHHINELTDDNRLENLMLFPSNGEHLRYHAAVRRAETIGPCRHRHRYDIARRECAERRVRQIA